MLGAKDVATPQLVLLVFIMVLLKLKPLHIDELLELFNIHLSLNLILHLHSTNYLNLCINLSKLIGVLSNMHFDILREPFIMAIAY